MDIDTPWSWILVAALAVAPLAGCGPATSGERLEAAGLPPASKAEAESPAAAPAPRRSPEELQAERAELEAVFRDVIQPVLNEPIATESTPAGKNSSSQAASAPAKGQ